MGMVKFLEWLPTLSVTNLVCDVSLDSWVVKSRPHFTFKYVVIAQNKTEFSPVAKQLVKLVKRRCSVTPQEPNRQMVKASQCWEMSVFLRLDWRFG